MADAVAKRAVACNDTCVTDAGGPTPCTYQQEHDGFIIAAANGDCKNITAIRDEAALRNTCLPSLQTISCADLKAPNLDPSCKMQLLIQ
jgi:hypothetical protein